MIKLFRYRHRIISALALPLPLLFLLIDAPVFGGGKREQEIRLEKINPTSDGDAVVITYDLIAPNDKKYEVRLVMQRESDRGFQFIPKTVSGDAGEGKFAGKGREIRWSYKLDAPKGFQGDDYYFILAVKKAGGSKGWLYFTLTTAAAGGAVYAFKDKIFPPDTPLPPTELPAPPERP